MPSFPYMCFIILCAFIQNNSKVKKVVITMWGIKLNKNHHNMFSLRSIGSLIVLVVIGASLLWMSFHLNLPSPEEMRKIILSYGAAGCLVFIGITIIIAITPIPITIPTLVAGSLYGVVGGTLLSLSGIMIGSWIGYWLARIVGRRITFKLLGRYSFVVEKHLNNAGFWAMCTVKLTPGLPYWPVNYGAGALGVKQWSFISASFLASIPGQASIVTLGAFAVNPSIFHGVVLIIAWATVLLSTWISYRHWRGANTETQKPKHTE